MPVSNRRDSAVDLHGIRPEPFTPSSLLSARGIAASVLSGLLLGASVPPSPAGLLATVAFVPLFVHWRRNPSPPAVLVEAGLASLTAGLVAYGWIVQHPSPSVVLASVGAILTWSLLLAGPWSLAAWVQDLLGRARPPSDHGSTPVLLLLGSAGVLAVEGALTHAPWPFPWGHLGHTQALVPGVRQLAALGGTPALSAFVLAVNAAVALLLGGRRTPAAILGAIIAVALGMGVARAPSEAPPARTATVWMVQPNLPADRWAAPHDHSRVHHLQRLTDRALDTARVPPDLVVWPETALPPAAPAVRDSLQAWSTRRGVGLLTGAVARIDDPEAAYDHANRAVLFTPQWPVQTYDKTHPVPFVEHVPGADLLPGLRALRVDGGGVQGYRRGSGAVALASSRLTVGPLICFESAVGPLARQYVTRAPADALVILAQTGWWGTPWPAQQHRALSHLRALETGRPLLLSTVRGPTTVLHPDGSAGPSLSWDEEGVLHTRVPLYSALPPVARTGDLISPLAAVVVAVGVAFALVQGVVVSYD